MESGSFLSNEEYFKGAERSHFQRIIERNPIYNNLTELVKNEISLYATKFFTIHQILDLAYSTKRGEFLTKAQEFIIEIRKHQISFFRDSISEKITRVLEIDGKIIEINY